MQFYGEGGCAYGDTCVPTVPGAQGLMGYTWAPIESLTWMSTRISLSFRHLKGPQTMLRWVRRHSPGEGKAPKTPEGSPVSPCLTLRPGEGRKCHLPSCPLPGSCHSLTHLGNLGPLSTWSLQYGASLLVWTPWLA